MHCGAREGDWPETRVFLSLLGGSVASWSSGLCTEMAAKRTQEVCLSVCFLNSLCLVSALL